MKLCVWKDLHFQLLPSLWYRPASFVFGEPFPGAVTLQWLHRGLSLQWMPQEPPK